MDGNSSSGSIADLVKEIQRVQDYIHERDAVHQATVFRVLRFGFIGLSVVMFVVSVAAKVSGVVIVDSQTDRFVFSMAVSLVLFSIGTEFIERFRGDMFGGFLGRALALCGMFVISAQCWQFMQKAREIDIEVMVKQHARPVSETQFVALRSMTCKNGAVIEWELDDDGRTRPVSVARGRSSAGRDRIQSSLANTDGQSRGAAEMPRRKPGVATGTNGNGRTF